MLGIFFISFLGLNKLKIITSSFITYMLFISLISKIILIKIYSFQTIFWVGNYYPLSLYLGFLKFLFKAPEKDEKKEMKKKRTSMEVKNKQTRNWSYWTKDSSLAARVPCHVQFAGHRRHVVKTAKQLVRGHRCFMTKCESAANGKLSLSVSLSPYPSSPNELS